MDVGELKTWDDVLGKSRRDAIEHLIEDSAAALDLLGRVAHFSTPNRDEEHILILLSLIAKRTAWTGGDICVAIRPKPGMKSVCAIMLLSAAGSFKTIRKKIDVPSCFDAFRHSVETRNGLIEPLHWSHEMGDGVILLFIPRAESKMPSSLRSTTPISALPSRIAPSPPKIPMDLVPQRPPPTIPPGTVRIRPKKPPPPPMHRLRSGPPPEKSSSDEPDPIRVDEEWD